MHRDLVLTCSNPFAEGHGFVTRSFCLVQLCPDRPDRWMISWEDSNQFPKPLDRLLVAALDGASFSCCDCSSGFLTACRSRASSFSNATTLADSLVDLVGCSRFSDFALKASPFAR